MRFVLLTLVLVACGTENAPTEQPVAASATAQPDDKPDAMAYSIVLAGAADLPPCDEEHQKQLVYLAAENEFRYCADKYWAVINVRGPAGQDGEDGVAGAKGDTGAAGATGPTGATGPAGQDGEDAPVVSANEWINPSTGKSWIVGSTGTPGTIQCPVGYATPTAAELSAAVTAGIYVPFADLIATNSTYACGYDTGGGRAIKAGTTCTLGSAMGSYCIQYP